MNWLSIFKDSCERGACVLYIEEHPLVTGPIVLPKGSQVVGLRDSSILVLVPNIHTDYELLEVIVVLDMVKVDDMSKYIGYNDNGYVFIRKCY